jgi:hypothetical protein
MLGVLYCQGFHPQSTANMDLLLPNITRCIPKAGGLTASLTCHRGHAVALSSRMMMLPSFRVAWLRSSQAPGGSGSPPVGSMGQREALVGHQLNTAATREAGREIHRKVSKLCSFRLQRGISNGRGCR